MLDNTINIIKNFSREDWRIILSILSLVTRIADNLICLYQSKRYYGKRTVKKQIKVDYKTIWNIIDLIIAIAKLFL